MKKNRLSLSIGVKYSLIIGSLVLFSLSSVTFIVSHFMKASEGISAEANNLTLNSRTATSVEKEITGICSNAFQLLDMMYEISETGNTALLRETESIFFQRNDHIAAVYICDSKGNPSLKILNSQFIADNKIEKSFLQEFLSKNKTALMECSGGKTYSLNATPQLGVCSMGVMIPWGTKGEYSAVVVFSTDSISETIASTGHSVNNTFIVNSMGDYLVHSDLELVKNGKKAAKSPLIAVLSEASESNGQIKYKDNSGDEYFGAYKKIPALELGVLTTAKSSLVYEAIVQTTINNVFLTVVILGLTVFIVLMYTHFGIAKPLRILKASVEEITRGNFSNSYKELLNVKRRDEIGVLNAGINDECQFLNTFSKFTNQKVATAIATKSIDFESHLKDVSIFFSDIRGFTTISDGFKNRFGNESAKHIISFLNDYMSRMVQCVTLSHGTIDKFEGDAIMAVWGIFREDDLSYENLPEGKEKSEKEALHLANVREDALNCITGSIAMRYALMEYNKQAAQYSAIHFQDKDSAYKPHIRIGCGINTGRASIGLMGSEDKMEYTSIGDAVNFASRTEASNKACGTDILISEDTYNLLKLEYIRCQENNFTIKPENLEKELVVERIPVGFEVKGKGEQHFYGVVNMPCFDIEKFFKEGNPDFTVDPECEKSCGKNGPASLNEVRSLLGIPVPDFAKVDLNEEENKIKVKH